MMSLENVIPENPMRSALLTVFFLVFAIVLGSTVRPVSADIIFELVDSVPAFADGLNDGDSVTVDGITLTFFNVVVSNGSSFGDVEAAGILMSSSTDPSLTDVIRFDFSFSQEVQISAYTIGVHEDVPLGSFFSVSGTNGTSGNNTIPDGSMFADQTFVFDPGTIPAFEAGQVYSFTHNLPVSGDPLFNFKGFTVSSVPEPSSTGLISLGILLFALRRKRRASKTSV